MENDKNHTKKNDNGNHNLDQMNIRQEDLFQVPDGFFDQLENEILSKTIEQDSGNTGVHQEEEDLIKVISLHSSKKQSRVWIWSAAAILIVGVSSYFFFNLINSEQAKDQELANNSYMEEVEQTLNEISTDDMLSYIEDVYGTEGAGNTILNYAETNGVELEAASNLDLDVSNEELIEELYEMDIDIDIEDVY